jgi:hypothetical protein
MEPGDQKNVAIGGKPGKRFAVYRFVHKEPFELIAEYDTIEEVRSHHWQFARDQRVRLQHGECWKFLPLTKFEEWAKRQ